MREGGRAFMRGPHIALRCHKGAAYVPGRLAEQPEQNLRLSRPAFGSRRSSIDPEHKPPCGESRSNIGGAAVVAHRGNGGTA